MATVVEYFNGCRWTVELPAGWTQQRDTSRKGWPFVLQSPLASTLSLFSGIDPRIGDSRFGTTPDQAEIITRIGRISAERQPTVKYPETSPVERGWESYIYDGAYFIRAEFRHDTSAFDADEKTARDLLAKLRFHASAS